MEKKLNWPLLVVILGVLSVGGYMFSVWTASRLARDAGSALEEGVRSSFGAVSNLAERFRSGEITQTFLASVPEVHSAGSGRLEVATSTVTEMFERSDEYRVFWGLLSLGSTISQIQVPVTYRYHVNLADPWRIEVSGQTCLVYAPAIQGSQPPAIHTDRMEKRSQAGWARLDAQQQLDTLQKSITPILRNYAGDSRHLNVVKDQCRRTIAEFVRDWLLREDHWRQDRFQNVVVFFPDEVLSLEAPVEARELPTAQ